MSILFALHLPPRRLVGMATLGMKLTRKRAIAMAIGLLGAPGLAALMDRASARQVSKVEMVLETVSLTNTGSGPMPVATFRVSNAGSKSAIIMFDEVAPATKPLSQLMPSAVAGYGQCVMPPGTSCIVNITGPLGSDYWTRFVQANPFATHPPSRYC